MPDRFNLNHALDWANPCPWCGAQPGHPCRGDKGRGRELTHGVHTPRTQPPRPAEPA